MKKINITISGGLGRMGSLLIKKTIQDKQTSVEHIIANGRNRANALRDQARQAKKAGRDALISGFLSAGGSAASAYSSSGGSSSSQSSK